MFVIRWTCLSCRAIKSNKFSPPSRSRASQNCLSSRLVCPLEWQMAKFDAPNWTINKHISRWCDKQLNPCRAKMSKGWWWLTQSEPREMWRRYDQVSRVIDHLQSCTLSALNYIDHITLIASKPFRVGSQADERKILLSYWMNALRKSTHSILYWAPNRAAWLLCSRAQFRQTLKQGPKIISWFS